MKKTTPTVREKIAVRAYYAWLNGSTAGAEADWLAAEQIERAYAERRAGAARTAAETRRAKAVLPAPIITAAASASPRDTREFPKYERRPAIRFPTAH